MQFHIFERDIAVDYGPAEADLLFWFGFVLEGKGSREELYTKEGACWVRLSLRQLQAEFAYYSPYILRTALLHLEDCQLLKSDAEDRTLTGRRKKLVGYTLTDKGWQLCKSIDLQHSCG